MSIYNTLPKLQIVAGGERERTGVPALDYIQIRDGIARVSNGYVFVEVNLVAWDEAFEGFTGYVHREDWRMLCEPNCRNIYIQEEQGRIVATEEAATFNGKLDVLETPIVATAAFIREEEFKMPFPMIHRVHPERVKATPNEACVRRVGFSTEYLIDLTHLFTGQIAEFTFYEHRNGKDLAPCVVRYRDPGEKQPNPNMEALLMPVGNRSIYASIKKNEQ